MSVFHVILVPLQLDCDKTFELLVAAVRLAETTTGRIHDDELLFQTFGAVQALQAVGLFAPFEQAGTGLMVTVKPALFITSPVEAFDACIEYP